LLLEYDKNVAKFLLYERCSSDSPNKIFGVKSGGRWLALKKASFYFVTPSPVRRCSYFAKVYAIYSNIYDRSWF